MVTRDEVLNKIKDTASNNGQQNRPYCYDLLSGEYKNDRLIIDSLLDEGILKVTGGYKNHVYISFIGEILSKKKPSKK